GYRRGGTANALGVSPCGVSEARSWILWLALATLVRQGWQEKAGQHASMGCRSRGGAGDPAALAPARAPAKHARAGGCPYRRGHRRVIWGDGPRGRGRADAPAAGGARRGSDRAGGELPLRAWAALVPRGTAGAGGAGAGADAAGCTHVRR